MHAICHIWVLNLRNTTHRISIILSLLILEDGILNGITFIGCRSYLLFDQLSFVSVLFQMFVVKLFCGIR